MSTNVANIVNRRDSFAGSAIQGRVPLTEEQRKLARAVADPKLYRKKLLEESDMRSLIDKIINLKRSEGLDEAVAVRVAVALLEMQESARGEQVYKQFQKLLTSMNIPLDDLGDLHLHLNLDNPKFLVTVSWTPLNRPGVLNLFAHIAGLQPRVTMAARHLDSALSELSETTEMGGWLADLQNNYLEAGMANPVIQLEGIRARLSRSNHSLAMKALNLINIWEATNRDGAPEDVVAFILNQLSRDMATWTPPMEQPKRSLAALGGGGGENCAYCRQPGHGYRRCNVRVENIEQRKPHPPHWKEHYHTESAH